jgi:hypothetical protein
VSDPIRHLSISQSPVFLLNSRLGLFTASASLRRLFSRSYESILPSSLATDHSSALGYSPRLPVSVCGTGCIYLSLRGFSWKLAWGRYRLSIAALAYYRISAQPADFPTSLTAYVLQRAIPSARGPYASPSPHRNIYRYGNINPFSIRFACRLLLRSRLTLF